MLSHQNLIRLSAGILIGVSYGTSVLAQDTQAPVNAQGANPTTEVQSVPQNLNPNANPLLFPTKPSEVDIKVVQPITLNQAIELALKNNKSLQEARLTLERTQAELLDAQGALYPTVSTQLELNRENSAAAQAQNELAVQQGFTAGQSEDSTNALGRLELSYDIYTGGERGARIQRAEISVRNSQLEVERISEETRFNATQNYYELQRSDAQVAIAQAAVEDAAQSLRDAQLLEQAGLGTKFSVLQAEVDLATANQDLTRAIANQRIARRRLAEILSIGQQVELTAAEVIQEAGDWALDLDKSIVLAYKNRAELQQQLLQKEIAEQDSYIALAGIKPQINFFANYNFNDDFDDTVGVADGYALGTRLSWILFDGGRADARARQAYRNMDIADTNFALIRNQIRLQVEEGYYNLISSKDNIQTAAKNVETATESLRLARLRFQAGVGTQTDVINSQRDLTDARSRYLQAIVDYNQSLNSLQRAVSNLPDNRLFELR